MFYFCYFFKLSQFLLLFYICLYVSELVKSFTIIPHGYSLQLLCKAYCVSFGVLVTTAMSLGYVSDVFVQTFNVKSTPYNP